MQADAQAGRGGDRAGAVERRAAELVGVAQQRHADAEAGGDLDGRTDAGSQRDARGRERPRRAVRLCGVGAARASAARPARTAHGRATSHAPPRRNGQASRLAASSVNEARAARLGRSSRQACVAPTKTRAPTRRPAPARPFRVIAIPGMTAGAGPKIVWPATETPNCRRAGSRRGRRRTAIRRWRAAPVAGGRRRRLCDGWRSGSRAGFGVGRRRRSFRPAGTARPARGLRVPGPLQRRIERHGDDERDRVGRLGARSRDESPRRLLGAGRRQDELRDHVSGTRRGDHDLGGDGGVVDELDARRTGRDARREIAARDAIGGAAQLEAGLRRHASRPARGAPSRSAERARSAGPRPRSSRGW